MADRGGFPPPFLPSWLNTGVQAPPSESRTNPNPNSSVDRFGIRGIVRDELAMDLGFGSNPRGFYPESRETSWAEYHDDLLTRELYYYGNNSKPSTCVENGIIPSNMYMTSSSSGVDPIHNQFVSKSFVKFPQKCDVTEKISYPQVEGNLSFLPQLDSCPGNIIPCHLATPYNGKFIKGCDASSRVSGDRIGASIGSFPLLDVLQNTSVSLDQTVDSPCWKGASTSNQSAFDFVETLTQNKLLTTTIQQPNRGEAKHDEEKQMGQEEKFSQAAVVSNSDGISEKGASSIFTGKNASLSFIVGELQSLSNLLLSSEIDASQLNNHNNELLKLVIDNLEAFLLKTKKICGMKSDFAMNHSTIEQVVDCEIGNKFLSIETNISNGELDDFGLNDTDSTAQAFQKILQKKFSNVEENLQAQVYKKLWIDAEAALCSMKYKLQLAQMKIEAENRNHQTEGQLQRVSSISSVDSLDHKKPEASRILEHLSRDEITASIHGQDGSLLRDTDFDALVMARLDVLKGRGDQENLTSTTEKQPKFVLGFSPVKLGFLPSNELENVMGSADIDAQVVDRLEVLGGRGNVESFMSTDKHHENSVQEEAPADVMSGVDIDSQVMARLEILRGRGDGKSFMSTAPPVDTLGSADVDALVMARLGILRDHDDTESSISTEVKPEKIIPEEAPANVLDSPDKSLQGEAPATVMVNTEIDASVMAKPGVLGDRGNAESFTSTEKQSENSLPEAPVSVIDKMDYDALVMARLSILKGRDDGLSYMSTEHTSDVNDGELSSEWEHVLFDDLI